MRYVLKQKLWSLGESFVINDAGNHPAFQVKGKVLSVADKLSFQDMQGHELASIQERALAWGPTYEVLRDGQTAAVVKKKLFSLMRARFTVDVPGPDDLEAVGSFWEQEYTFQRGDATVATVSRRWFSWSDTYGVDVADGEDDVLILACAVVISLICSSEEAQA